MARVEIIKPREQAAHFGLYRTSAGGDESIIVRRKVGEPTDYMHSKSRKLKRQRDNLALASQHYAHLTPSQKAIGRHQIEEIEYQKSHGKTDTKLLMGRQLFISKEMRSLESTGKQLYLPHEICIMLVDENHLPLEGTLWLHYLDLGEWWNINGEEIGTGNWLFSLVPRGMTAYRPYGEAEDYYDPELPEHQFMTEDEIRAYHYHVLLTALTSYCHSPRTDINGLFTGHCVRVSQPFIPCTSFELKQIFFTLRRHDNPTWPPLTTGFIAIHNATEGRKPIDPPLRIASFDISVPEYPEWAEHKVTFEPILLEADTLYTWVMGFDYQPPERGRIYVEKGEEGLCNLDPITPTFLSYWVEGNWQDWQLFDLLQLSYEMRGSPPE